MTDEKSPGVPLTPVDFDPFAETAVSDVLPLTEPQTEIWAAVQMGSDASCAYNQCFVLTLRGALSAESMQNALRQVMDRHDALRVSIDPETQHQLISGSSQIVLPVIDLSGHSPDSRTAEIEHLLHIETTQPFDLAAGPLVRAKLIREAPDVHRLVITAHHIVCDGWSSAVLFGDLARIYAADRHGLPAQLPVASSYRDYVAREAVRADDAQARADADYWAQQYADSIPVLDLPLDAPRPGIKTYSGARQELRLDESLCRALKAAGAKHGCTLFVTLLAGFEALLSRLSGQEDFVVGVSMAGQTLLENGHLVGHCVNLIPLRCRIDAAARIADHLKNARHALLESQSHQQLTFGTLVRRLKVPRDPSRTPLVSVTFNIDKIGAPFNFGDVMLEAVESPPKRFVNFEISINVVDRGRDLVLECEYNTDLFTPATIARWLGHYKVLLEAIASDPEQRIDELPLLTGIERHQLLVEWNDTAADYPTDALLHRLFEAQAARTPDAVAVMFEDQRLSYHELDARANQLARHLQRRGVGPIHSLRSVSSVRWKWSLPSSASSRPAAPTCPWIRRFRRSACVSWPRMHNSRCSCLPLLWRAPSVCPASANCCSMSMPRPSLPRRIRTCRSMPIAHSPRTRPMSSTPLAPPASPRVLWCRTVRSSTSSPAWPRAWPYRR